MESTTVEKRAFVWVGILIAIVGFLAAWIGETNDRPLVKDMGIAVGTGVLTSIMLYALDRAFPSKAAAAKILSSNRKIYNEYYEAIERLNKDKRPHEIWATSSSPQNELYDDGSWDKVVVNLLKENSSVTFTRVLMIENRESAAWKHRLKVIKEKYCCLQDAEQPRYRQYEVVSPPTIEFFLIDDTCAFLTFAAGLKREESSGVMVTDPEFCKELRQHCERHICEKYTPVSLNC